MPEVSLFSVRLDDLHHVEGGCIRNLKLLSSPHLFPLISATCAWIVLGTSVQAHEGCTPSTLFLFLRFACLCALTVTEPVISA